MTSGIRIGTAAITTRGVSKNDVEVITELIDQALQKQMMKKLYQKSNKK